MLTGISVPSDVPGIVLRRLAGIKGANEDYEDAVAAWEAAAAQLARVRLSVQRDGGTFSARRGWRPSGKAKETGKQLPKLIAAADTARLARDAAGEAVTAARVAQREAYEQACRRAGRFEPRSNIGAPMDPLLAALSRPDDEAD